MKVEIWSDVVCPFCYIGKRRFEQGLKAFSGAEKVEIVWRSFQLDPDAEAVPGQSVYEYLALRKGVTTAEGKAMYDGVAAMAKVEGLTYNFDTAVTANTLDAHRLLHVAKAAGLQNELKERLFHAYYTESADIGDRATLARLAGEVGLNEEEAHAALESAEYEADVAADQYAAQQAGVRGVPFFVFNGKYAVSGAQPASVFTEVMERLVEEQRPLVLNNDGAQACTPGGECS